MNFDFYLADIDYLICYITKYSEKGWRGALTHLVSRYEKITTGLPYNWFFCKDLFYEQIDESVKGNDMEFDALLYNLNTLKKRIESCERLSTIHIDVKFEKLKDIIIAEIQKAQLSICIAVAWLSDKDILNAISLAVERAIDIKIILIDCETNQKYNPAKKKVQFEFVPQFGEFSSNYMHNKFCIFDMTTIITGSYNWSNNANYNDENIVIITNQEIAKKFQQKFNDLWNEYCMYKVE